MLKNNVFIQLIIGLIIVFLISTCTAKKEGGGVGNGVKQNDYLWYQNVVPIETNTLAAKIGSCDQFTSLPSGNSFGYSASDINFITYNLKYICEMTGHYELILYGQRVQNTTLDCSEPQVRLNTLACHQSDFYGKSVWPYSLNFTGTDYMAVSFGIFDILDPTYVGQGVWIPEQFASQIRYWQSSTLPPQAGVNFDPVMNLYIQGKFNNKFMNGELKVDNNNHENGSGTGLGPEALYLKTFGAPSNLSSCFGSSGSSSDCLSINERYLRYKDVDGNGYLSSNDNNPDYSYGQSPSTAALIARWSDLYASSKDMNTFKVITREVLTTPNAIANNAVGMEWNVSGSLVLDKVKIKIRAFSNISFSNTSEITSGFNFTINSIFSKINSDGVCFKLSTMELLTDCTGLDNLLANNFGSDPCISQNKCDPDEAQEGLKKFLTITDMTTAIPK